VAAGIPVEMEDKRAAEANTSDESSAVGRKLKEGAVEILMGSSVHQGRSKSVEKAVGIFV